MLNTERERTHYPSQYRWGGWDRALRESVMKLVGHFDGSCEPVNPGGTARYGFTVWDERTGYKYFGNGLVGSGDGMTNNVAEASGVIALLRYVLQEYPYLLADEVFVYGDSEICINQLRGRKKEPKGAYAPYIKEAVELAAQLKQKCRVFFHHIPRERNWEADELSKKPTTD